MAFPFAGALISGGAALGGSLISAFSDRENAEDSRHFAEQQARENAQLQREFAQNGVRWRVEDAQAAGLHPLYALGGAGATFTPSASSVNFDNGGRALGEGLARAGQEVGRAVSAQQTPVERDLQQLQLRSLEASVERDYAQASYWRAQAAKISQGVGPGMPNDVVTNAYGGAETFPVKGSGHIEAHPLYKDAVKLTPDEMSSRDARFGGQTAGRDHPAMRQFEFPGGFKMLLPASGQGGVPEEIDFAMLPLIIGANMERYGARWLIDAASYMTGRSPEKRDARARELGFSPPRR